MLRTNGATHVRMREGWMTHLITATYDGSSSLQLDEPLPLEPNTRVVISVQSADPDSSGGNGADFFDIALGMDLGGPPDWSARIDHYLYGGMVGDED
jgi:hypothetical protein